MSRFVCVRLTWNICFFLLQTINANQTHFRRCHRNPRVAVFCFQVTETQGSCLYRKLLAWRVMDLVSKYWHEAVTSGVPRHFRYLHHARCHAFYLPLNSVRMDKTTQRSFGLCVHLWEDRITANIWLQLTLISDKRKTPSSAHCLDTHPPLFFSLTAWHLGPVTPFLFGLALYRDWV